MSLLRDLGLILAVLAGAVGGSQVPRFVQEYEQRLGGAVQALDQELARFAAVAGEQKLSFADYLDRLKQAGQPSTGTAAAIEQTQDRAANLHAEAERLASTPAYAKPVVLAQAYDSDLLRGTWDAFAATLTLDPTFAILGALLGWLLIGVLGGLARLLKGGRRTKRPRNAYAPLAAQPPGNAET